MERVVKRIESLRDEMVALWCRLIETPAISPDYGYEGEWDRAKVLLEHIKGLSFDSVEVYECPDERAKEKSRPNIIARILGGDGRRLWILSHMDTVPPGDMGGWTETEPFKARVKDGRIYGRGAEDNLQGLVASLTAARALLEEKIPPAREVILAFVSDEETGCRYGLEWLMKEHPELFKKEDLVLVPDWGNKEGTFIEIAEKSMLWVKVRVLGKQVHASTPNRGLNAHRVAIELGHSLIRRLHELFDAKDPLYDPPKSTFEPTMARAESDSPNIAPGLHEMVFDCRVLPEISLDHVLSAFQEEAKKAEGENPGCRVELEVMHRLDAPPPTPKDSEIVKLLREAVAELRGKEANVGGVGGGTFAAYFRKLGIPAVVWSTIEGMAHQPNEYAVVDNMLEDAKVMAYLMLKKTA